MNHHAVMALPDGRVEATLQANNAGSALTSHAEPALDNSPLELDMACAGVMPIFDANLKRAAKVRFRQLAKVRPRTSIIVDPRKKTPAAGIDFMPGRWRLDFPAQRQSGATDECSNDWCAVGQLLNKAPSQRRTVLPAHSLDENLELSRRFLNEIALRTANHSLDLTQMAVSPGCGSKEHVPPRASLDLGHKLSGVDTIADHLTSNAFPERQQLDFKPSIENGGGGPSEGLPGWKESVGAWRILSRQSQIPI